MAVSGRKTSDFQGSVSIGSAEDFDHSCDPCLTAGQHTEAHGYCVNCGEYLCKNCCTYHQRLKATKHHQLLDKSNMPRHAISSGDSSEVCTERCSVHRNEIIKYFCTQHEKLGCTDCITLHHRTCGLEYIPDKCADIGDSDEFKEIMQKLDQKVKDVEEVMKTATDRDKEIDTSHDNIMKDVIQFRKEINHRLDQLQQKIQEDADKKKSTDKQNIQSVFATCTTVSSDMKKFQTSLQDNKRSGRNGQVYIEMKRAKSNLKSDEVEHALESLAMTDIQYRFERNQDLKKMLCKQDELGNLTLSVSLVSPRKNKTLEKLTHKEDITVRTKADMNNCYNTGCAVLSSNKLVLADRLNRKLKVVDAQSKSVMEEKTLDSVPFDIAVLPHDQIAVTMPEEKEILILTTNGKLSVLRRIPVTASCFGIDYHQDQLCVVCTDTSCVVILDTQGNVQKAIPLDYKSLNYILFSAYSKLIYISDYCSSSVISMTLQGKISSVYKFEKGSGTLGMVLLDDGSLLVCCSGNGTVHHISGDLKEGKTMVDNLLFPRSICYNHHQHEVYIGGALCDQLKVFNPE